MKQVGYLGGSTKNSASSSQTETVLLARVSAELNTLFGGTIAQVVDDVAQSGFSKQVELLKDGGLPVGVLLAGDSPQWAKDVEGSPVTYKQVTMTTGGYAIPILSTLADGVTVSKKDKVYIEGHKVTNDPANATHVLLGATFEDTDQVLALTETGERVRALLVNMPFFAPELLAAD